MNHNCRIVVSTIFSCFQLL
uniref:Uncharacterized protein n=1 Tax=Rhizophora mucronata TaxID=61149 RepID=A0A2P2NB25_RHIMU